MNEPKIFIDKILIYSAEVEFRTGEKKLLQAYALSANGFAKLQKLTGKVQANTDDLTKVSKELSEIMFLIFGGDITDYGELTLNTIQKIILDFFDTIKKNNEANEAKEKTEGEIVNPT